MKKLLRYEITNQNFFEIFAPQDAQLLTVHEDQGKPCLWLRGDPEAPGEHLSFRIVNEDGKFNDPSVFEGHSTRYITTFDDNHKTMHLFQFNFSYLEEYFLMRGGGQLEEALEIFEEAHQKWREIIRGKRLFTNRSCPLLLRKYVVSNCVGCPVRVITDEVQCKNTPYALLMDHMEGFHFRGGQIKFPCRVCKGHILEQIKFFRRIIIELKKVQVKNAAIA